MNIKKIQKISFFKLQKLMMLFNVIVASNNSYESLIFKGILESHV